jgi:hypothetical protein
VVRLVCAVLVALSLATGCGGSKTLTKAQYVSRLNAMCRDFAAREKAIGNPGDLANNSPRIADAFEKAIADKVHNLKAPAEIGKQANRMAAIADEELKVLRGLADAAKRSDFTNMSELASKNAALNEESGSIAKELGANDCD